MEKVRVRIKGIVPIMLKSKASMDRDNPLQMELEVLIAETSGAKAKNEKPEQRAQKRWLQWQLAIEGYWNEETKQVFLPAQMVEACIRDGAKNWRLGEAVKRGVMVEQDEVILQYQPMKNSLAELYNDEQFVDTRPTKKLMTSRARFNSWEATFSIIFDKGQIKQEELKRALDFAGRYKALGTYRPRFGRFKVAKFEEV